MENETEPMYLDPRPLLMKKLIWDIFPHNHDIAKVQRKLGLSVDAEDGLEVDHRASDARIALISDLIPAAQIMTRLISEIMGVYMVEMMEAHGHEMDLPDDFYEQFADQNHEIIYLGSLSFIAQLMDTGVLKYDEETIQAAIPHE